MGKIVEIRGSSVINAVQYIEGKQEMRIRFTSGKVYRYVEFPRDMYEQILTEEHNGGSVGGYYNRSIKGQYPAVEVGKFAEEASLEDKPVTGLERAEARFYEELQAAIVVKGGRKMDTDELQEMTMSEFWTIARNGIRLKVELV